MASTETALPELYPEDREYVEELTKLQAMHDQIHGLRGLLPERLLKPARAAIQNPAGTSPAKLAIDLRTTATQGSIDIRRFAADFRSDQMQQLWRKTSSGDFPQGVDAWTVNYQELLKSSASEPVTTNSQTDGAAAIDDDEDFEAVVNKFRDVVKNLKIQSPDTASVFPLDVSTNELSFRITRENQRGTNSLEVSKQPATSSTLTEQVVKAINEGTSPTRLEVLLRMLESYSDLKFRPCDKCQSIFDNNVTYPILRIRKPSTNKEDTTIEWSALHPGCVK